MLIKMETLSLQEIKSQKRFIDAQILIVGKQVASFGFQNEKISDIQKKASGDIHLLNEKRVPFAFYFQGSFIDSISGFKYTLK